MFDYLVVGKGLMGSAATRYLAQESDSVAVMGPDEPAEQSTHSGIFGAHYDEARIISQVVNREPVWAALSHQTLTQVPLLNEALGKPVVDAVGAMAVLTNAERDAYIKTSDGYAALYATSYEMLTPDEVQARLPWLHLPAGYTAVWESPPAGRLNPRRILQAQLAAAEGSGATIIREIVSHIEETGDGLTVHTREGNAYEARKVLVATGAYSGVFRLLPRKPALRLKPEHVVMGEVSAQEAQRLRTTPPFSFHLQHPNLADLYMFPPVPYPDGRYYIKMGANTSKDFYVETLDEINDWYRSGNSDAMLETMRTAVQDILPDVQFESWHTGRCVITRTAHAKPYIDTAIAGKLYTAIGGNGTSAQASDGIGQLAAGLMIHDAWQSELDKNAFRLVCEDDNESWGNRELARGAMCV